MDNSTATNLGSGVRVEEAVDGSLVVTSHGLDLGWTTGAGRVPGSAVIWRDEPYEVVGRSVTSIDCRWTLRPWPDTESIRSSTVLSAGLVERIASELELEQRARNLHWWSIILLPVLGVAPRVLQERWRAEWGFPSGWATVLSSLIELAVGNLLFIHVLSIVLGGEPVLPWAPPVPLAGLLASWFTCEGLVRIVIGNADQYGVGSVLGLPLLVLTNRPMRAAAVRPSSLRIRPGDASLIEIETTHRRTDWEEEHGLLSYRDRWHQLEGVTKSGEDWLYRFRPVEAHPTSADRPTLHLRPPTQPRHEPRVVSGGLGSMLAKALITVFMCFAPREYQERWGLALDFPPAGLTAIGASAELIGGAVNSFTHAARGSPLLVLDLVVLAEGAMRLALALARKTSVGSIFGQPLRPLYERWTQPR